MDESYARIIFEEAKIRYSGSDINEKELERLKNKISGLESQIEATTERIVELPKGIDAKIFYTQIFKIQEQRAIFKGQLETLEAMAQTKEDPINFEDFKKFTEGLKALTEKCSNPDEQAAIARKLIERIEVAPKGIVIHYHVGTTHYLRELSDRRDIGVKSVDFRDNGSLLEQHSSKIKKGLVDLTRPVSKPLLKYRLGNSWVGCSNTLTIGRGAGT